MILKTLKVTGFPGTGDLEINMKPGSSENTYLPTIKSLVNGDVLGQTFTIVHVNDNIESRYTEELTRFFAYLPHLNIDFLSSILGDNPVYNTELVSNYFKFEIHYYKTPSDFYKYSTIVDRSGFNNQTIHKMVSGNWLHVASKYETSDTPIISPEEFIRVFYFHTRSQITSKQSPPQHKKSSNAHAELYQRIVRALKHSQKFSDYLSSFLIPFQLRNPLTLSKVVGLQVNDKEELMIVDSKNGLNIPFSSYSSENENFLKSVLFLSTVAYSMNYSHDSFLLIANEIDSFLNPYQIKTLYNLISDNRILKKNSQYLFSLIGSEDLSSKHPVLGLPFKTKMLLNSGTGYDNHS